MDREIFLNEQIDVDSLPSVERIDFIPLQKDYKLILLAFGTISAFIFGVAVIIAVWQFDFPQWLSILILVVWLLLTCLQFAAIILGFKHKGYAMRRRDISYKTGWLYKKQVTVPFSRIQHVDIKQGVIERWFDLAKLNVYTAGGNSSDLSVPGLLLKDARQMKSYILGVVEPDEEE